MSLLQRDDVESSSVKARHYHSQLNRFWAAVHQVHHLNNETKITRIEYGPDSLHAISRSRLFVVISRPWHSTKNKILSETAYFRQRQSFRCDLNQKWSGIQIRISGLIRIRVSTGSLSKFSGFTPLSASVLSPSYVNSGRWLSDCVRNAEKSREMFYSATAKKAEKWSGIRIRDRIATKS